MLVKLEFGDVGFCGGRKTRGPREKPLEQGNNQQTYPHMALGPAQCHMWVKFGRIKPEPCWWEASAFTTASSLLPKTCSSYQVFNKDRRPAKFVIYFDDFAVYFAWKFGSSETNGMKHFSVEHNACNLQKVKSAYQPKWLTRPELILFSVAWSG